MRRVEAVIFDMDGIVVNPDTLHDEAELAAAQIIADRHGYQYDSGQTDWTSLHGLHRRKIAAELFGIAFDSEEAEEYRLAFVDQSVQLATPENVPLIPGVVPFAGWLTTQGVVIGMATASQRALYNRYTEIHGIDLFPERFTIADGEGKYDDKPNPGPYLEIMERMGKRPNQTLVIDDSRRGIEAGRRSGALVMSLPTSMSVQDLWTRTGAQLVAADYHDAAHQLRPYLS